MEQTVYIGLPSEWLKHDNASATRCFEFGGDKSNVSHGAASVFQDHRRIWWCSHLIADITVMIFEGTKEYDTISAFSKAAKNGANNLNELNDFLDRLALNGADPEKLKKAIIEYGKVQYRNGRNSIREAYKLLINSHD